MLLCSVQVTSIVHLPIQERRIPFSVALPGLSYLPHLGIFKFFLIQFEGLRPEDVTSVQFIKAKRDNV